MNEQVLDVLLMSAGAINVIALFVVGFIVNTLASSIDELRKEDREISKRVGSLEQTAARETARYEAIINTLDRIETRLDTMQTQRDTDFRDAHGG